MVSIVDPRHPLYGRTFPLLHIKHQRNLILSCVVQVLPDASRLVPVDVTDLAATEPDVFPTPLALSSLHDLMQTFDHILAQVTTERCDDTNQDVPGQRGAAATGLADPQPHATATVAEDGGSRLSADGSGTDGGGEE